MLSTARETTGLTAVLAIASKLQGAAGVGRGGDGTCFLEDSKTEWRRRNGEGKMGGGKDRRETGQSWSVRWEEPGDWALGGTEEPVEAESKRHYSPTPGPRSAVHTFNIDC